MLMSSTYRPPDWAPLQRALAAEFGDDAIGATGAFWFIGFVEGPADIGELRQYEHSGTRRRLVLDREGGAYRWMADFSGFSKVSVVAALVDVLS